jgi:CO/xanthine dehydrogenase FAD-binding subunit
LGFRSTLSVSRIGLALRLDLDGDGVIKSAAVVAGAIAPAPVRIEAAERFLVGKKPGSEAAAEVGRILSALIMEITPELFDRDYKVEAAHGVAQDVFQKIMGGSV